MAVTTPNLQRAVEAIYGLPPGAISRWGGTVAAVVATCATDEEKRRIREQWKDAADA
jgi:hypothetical protein